LFSLFFLRKSHVKNSDLQLFIRQSFGFKPKNLVLYTQAFSHKSVAKKNTSGLKLSNERLEFLGDSVISTIVSEYLFEKFPNEDEGYLTQMRSKIVSRKNLNSLGKKIGLEPFVMYLKGNFPYKSLLGNVFEALFGAIYLDKGYKKAKEVFVKNILERYVDLGNLEAINIDYKSQLLIYCQKNKLTLEFKIIKEETVKGSIKFTMGAFINGELKGQSTDLSKRSAEQAAAEIVSLDII
jgi:ribonuclease III